MSEMNNNGPAASFTNLTPFDYSIDYASQHHQQMMFQQQQQQQMHQLQQQLFHQQSIIHQYQATKPDKHGVHAEFPPVGDSALEPSSSLHTRFHNSHYSSQKMSSNHNTQRIPAENASTSTINPLYESRICSIEDLKACVQNHKLKPLEFGQICLSAAKHNYGRFTIILEKFIRENRLNITDMALTEECYEESNQHLMTIANSCLSKILLSNMVNINKQVANFKSEDFDLKGSTSNVLTRFLITSEAGSSFKVGHSLHISDLDPPRQSSSSKSRIKHYCTLWLLNSSSDVKIWKSMTVTKCDFLSSLPCTDQTNSSPGKSLGPNAEDDAEESLNSNDGSDDLEVTHNKNSKEFEELPISIKKNMFTVFLQYFKIDSVLVTDSCLHSPSEIESHPDFLAMGGDWNSRVDELVSLRKQFLLFKNGVFVDQLQAAVHEMRYGTIDPETKKLTKRNRTSKSRQETAKRRKTNS